jgi:CheY-like chemotaxis protein
VRPESDGQPEPWRGADTILLVDDEAPVRNVAAKMLERCSFAVLVASDGYEAVDLLSASTPPQADSFCLA